MSEISSLLDQILRDAEEIGIAAGPYLNAGLSTAKIEELSANLPFRLPPDVVELYRWRNGMRLEGQLCEFRIIPGMVIEPLEDAVLRTNELAAAVDEPFALWKTTWYSLCTNLAGHYLALDVAAIRNDGGKVIAINMESNPYPAFQSFKQMLLSIADCYKAGVYLLDEERFLVEERRLSDIIYRLHNGGLSPILLESTNDLKSLSRRARQVFSREGRNDLLEKLSDLERRSGLG